MLIVAEYISIKKMCIRAAICGHRDAMCLNFGVSNFRGDHLKMRLVILHKVKKKKMFQKTLSTMMESDGCMNGIHTQHLV